MGVHKNMAFDKEYCILLNTCMNRGKYGGITFFVDMHMSDFTMKSCVNSEAITKSIVSERYFNEFGTPTLMDIELGLGDDGDIGDDDE